MYCSETNLNKNSRKNQPLLSLKVYIKLEKELMNSLHYYMTKNYFRFLYHEGHISPEEDLVKFDLFDVLLYY